MSQGVNAEAPNALSFSLLLHAAQHSPGALGPGPWFWQIRLSVRHQAVAEAFARALEKCVQRTKLEAAGEQPPSWQTIHRRIRWDAPALTCSANRPGSCRCLFRGVAGEDSTYHRLSLEEAACLMGFPPG